MEGFEMGQNFEKMASRITALEERTAHTSEVVSKNADTANQLHEFYMGKFSACGTGMIISSILFLGLGVLDLWHQRQIRQLREELEFLKNRMDMSETS